MQSKSALQQLLEDAQPNMTPQRKQVLDNFDVIDAIVQKKISFIRISLAFKDDGQPISPATLKKHYTDIKQQKLAEAKADKRRREQ